MAEGGAEEESSGDMLGPAAVAGVVPSAQHHQQHLHLHQSSPPPARFLPGGTLHSNNSTTSSVIRTEDSDRESSVESPEPASAAMGIDGTTDISQTRFSQTMLSEDHDKISNNNNSTHLNGAIAGLVTLQNLQNLASLQQSLPQVASLAANLQNMTTTLAASAAAAASASSLNAPLNLSITPASNMRTSHPTSNTESASALNNLANTAASLHTNAALPPNLLSSTQQPIAMPQFILASGQLVQGIQGAQLLIPTAQGLATQTILTIPVSHVNSSDQMVNLALNNGQVITTSLANLQAMAQPSLLSAANPTIPTTNGTLPHSHAPLNLNPTTISQLLQNGAAAAATTQQLMQSLPQILNHVNTNTHHQPQTPVSLQSNPQLPPQSVAQSTTASSTALLNSLAQQLTQQTHPAVVSSPSVAANLLSAAVNASSGANSTTATSSAAREVQRHQQERERQQHQERERLQERQERQDRLSGGYGSYGGVDKMHQQSCITSQQSGGNSNGPTTMLGKGGSVGSVASILPVSSNGSSASSTISRLNGELTITTTSMPPSSHPPQNISSHLKRSPSLSPCGDNSSTADLLIDSPNQPTINQANTNVVDGINLDEIKDFAKAFKLRRLSLGLTQTQVGQALSVTEGPAYSQSAICSALASQMFAAAQLSSQQQAMFEKLDITPKSAQKIKPVLERWMKEAEDRYKSGQNHLTDFIGMEPSKKRKRRTSFTPQALELLNAHFERNTHPSGTEITGLAHQLGYEREVIRIWFCNKRQALKNTVRMMSKGMV